MLRTKTRSAVFALMLIIAACYPDKNRKVDMDEIRFATTDASELFFKNIRKSDYRLEELPAATMAIYRYKNPVKRKFVSAALIVNWGNDQAFLMIEKEENLPDELMFLIKGDENTDTLLFDGSHHKQHAEVAIQIYNGLLDEREVLLVDNRSSLQVFTTEEKIAFRRLVFDFLRLVELR